MNPTGIFLLSYFFLYFGFVFVLKSIVVARRTGKNPLVIPKNESAYALIGRYFKLLLITVFIYVAASAFIYDIQEYLDAFSPMSDTMFRTAGIVLMMTSLAWTMIAQHQMHNSWRIGIDAETRTELVTHGLFRISRNPVFLGMIITLAGLFLVTPNAFTLIVLVAGYILIQLQIRLEEEFLLKQLGESYRIYLLQTRRLI